MSMEALYAPGGWDLNAREYARRNAVLKHTQSQKQLTNRKEFP